MDVRVDRVDPLGAVDELISLRTAWSAENGHDLVDAEAFATDFKTWLVNEAPHRQFWLLRHDGAAIGMVNLLVFDRMPAVGRDAGGWGYLCNMFVRKEHRNANLGVALATALLAYADRTGLERVVLSPSERSQPFYARLGFGAADTLLLRRRH